MGISNNYWRDYWDNIGGIIGINNGWKHWGRNNSIKLHSSLGEMVGILRN